MRKLSLGRALLAGLLALTALSAGAGTALAAAPDPDFIFVPVRPHDPQLPVKPPPAGTLNGPCGLGVDSEGVYYVSDYYRHRIDTFNQNGQYGAPPQFGYPFYLSQLTGIDPLDGPCGLDFDTADNLYVNDYHRAVIKYPSKASWESPPVAGTTIAGNGVDDTDPTGVAVDPASGDVYVDARTHVDVYVDARTHVDVYDSSGAQTGEIGGEDLENAYGLAFSEYSGTEGSIYVADQATNTVKVFDPSVSEDDPVAEIDGSETAQGAFTSLRDASLAVDRVTGELYVVDLLQPAFAERPVAVVQVFAPDGSYEGHLKYMIRDAKPAGIAVDNSATATQGRLYVTTGNTEGAGVYAYPPGSATDAEEPKPTTYVISARSAGSGEGTIESSRTLLDCSGTCEAPVWGGAKVNLTAKPKEGSVFTGWSGDCGGTQPTCSVTMDHPVTARAEFARVAPALERAGASETQQIRNVLLNVKAKLAPTRLPREDLSPVSVSVGWSVKTTDGTEPPKLKTVKIEINKNGILDTTGLPVCAYDKIQPASSDRALKNCKASLVGTGTFSALVGLEGQESYVAKGKMLVFKGEKRGKQVLYGQIYTAYPFANSFVVEFDVSQAKKGTYGTTLTAHLPANLRAWGNLTEVNMKLERKYNAAGKRHSFLSASCPTPKGFTTAVFKLARTSFSFDGGINAVSALTEQCKVRH